MHPPVNITSGNRDPIVWTVALVSSWKIAGKMDDKFTMIYNLARRLPFLPFTGF